MFLGVLRMTDAAPAKAGKILWGLGKIFLAFFLLYLVTSKTNIKELKLLKDDVLWGWVIGVFLLTFGLTLMKTLRYYVLLGEQGIYWQIFRITVVQNVVANFAATSAGLASYMALLKQDEDVGFSRSGSIFILTKFGDLFAIGFYFVLSSFLVWDLIEPLHEVTIFLASAILIVLIMFIVFVWWRENIIDTILKLAT